MGMYTTLDGQVEIADNRFNGQNLYHVLLQCINEGGAVAEVAKKFISLPRYDCIQMNFIRWGEGLSNILEVEADMKNYSGEIEMFLNDLLPLIAKDWHIDVQYEEWLSPITASKEDGYNPEEADWGHTFDQTY